MKKDIFLDNDWEFVWVGTRRNTETGLEEPATGLVNLTARISATFGGAAIHADLSKPLVERVSTPGEYFAFIDGDDLRTHLAAVSGVVYEVFGDGENVFYSAPRHVSAKRKA